MTVDLPLAAYQLLTREAVHGASERLGIDLVVWWRGTTRGAPRGTIRMVCDADTVHVFREALTGLLPGAASRDDGLMLYLAIAEGLEALRAAVA